MYTTWINIYYHFFFFFGFFFFMLASGKGILSPSSVGSVIFITFLISKGRFATSLTYDNLVSVMFGVKFKITLYSFGWFFKWSTKGSESLYKLFTSNASRFGHLLRRLWIESDNYVTPLNLSILKNWNPSGVFPFPFSPKIRWLIV